MARSKTCLWVDEYEELMAELRSREDVSEINVRNYSDYSGVEIQVNWIED